MPASVGARVAALVICVAGMAAAARAATDCPGEAAALTRDEAELPRLAVAPPADLPITCITLETVIDFAKRVKGHLARCPNSSYSGDAATWEETRADYVKRFIRRRCRRTFMQ
jgi:hypothetical protein